MQSPAKWLSVMLLVVSTSGYAADEVQSKPVLNQDVINRLSDMGSYLRTLKRFSVEAQVSQDVELDSGYKVKTLGKVDMTVDGRAHLVAHLASDRYVRDFYYNGTQFTQYSPALKYYTTVKAPDNVYDMLHEIEDYYGIQVPMEDLFQFGRNQDQIDALTMAAYVGPSKIAGKVCDHYAFSQPNVDWQLWIAREGNPLPCRLVITSTDSESKPEYSAEYHWNLKPAVKSGAFTFQPGKGDIAIPLKKADADTAAQ
ncbi:DUF2092 domain-containing protein [Silvimonas amylolytica]|uniref:DUF2092 domain-containing protein n=1 Tax=Silvimonas amylolytica TaxID=449663 RepID=A0ABQ2PHM4_9NEIS|nr:DUF2092 domain-containing protein [Silvimonas amylolytica]GGP24881.1 hypothetical protein GCM10010971_07000 [Silvimonas amylolytica]